MKKIFTLFLALAASVLTSVAQGQHGAMRFAGKSAFSVATVTVPVESDTIIYEPASQSTANITIPAMSYQMGQKTETIPSFVIHDVTFSMDMSTMTATPPSPYPS